MSEPILLIDFETYSELPLTGKASVGAAVYAEHPSTEILCMSWKFTGTSTRGCWVPGTEFPVKVIQHIAGRGMCEAHNVQFEFHIWKNLLYKAKHIFTFGRKYPLPPIPMPRRWQDTLASCAYHAIPLGLDDVGKVLNLDVVKNKRGKYLISKLCKPQKPTKKNPEIRCQDFGLLEELYDYCDQDVDAEEDLGDTIGPLSKSEYRVWLLDQKINMRGVQVDMETVRAAKAIKDEVFARLGAEVIVLTEGAVEKGTQVARIKDFLEDHGYPLPNLQKETVEDAIKMVKKLIDKYTTRDEDGKVPGLRKCLRMMEIRQQLGSASVAKIDKFLATTCADGRCRGMLQYHGAGTGRWSGRLVQPQNLPRGSITNACRVVKGKEEFYLDDELLMQHIRQRDSGLLSVVYGEPIDALTSALRGMFIAAPGKVLRVADFSAIEARGTMWLARQKDAIEAFRKYDAGIGPDIYCVMAEKLYGREIDKKVDKDERQLGKVTILGCGYQMGPPRLREQAEKDYSVILSEDQSEWLVGTYREIYHKVPGLWKGLENAAFEAIRKGSRQDYSYVGFEMMDNKAGKWLTCILPNGRRLWYYNADIRKGLTSWGEERWQITYEGRNNKRNGIWDRISTYGGMLTENIVQALSRDIMVEAMFRVEDAGYPIVLTVHDEVVSETDADYGSLGEFEKLVKGPCPSWASGFPLGADGFECTRYRKG